MIDKKQIVFTVDVTVSTLVGEKARILETLFMYPTLPLLNKVYYMECDENTT